MPVIVQPQQIREGEHIPTYARVTAWDGTAIFSAGVSQVDVKVFNLSSATPHTAIYSAGSLAGTIAAGPSPTTGAVWTLDTTGYTFGHVLTHTLVPTVGGNSYLIEYKITTSSYGDIYVTVTHLILPVTST